MFTINLSDLVAFSLIPIASCSSLNKFYVRISFYFLSKKSSSWKKGAKVTDGRERFSSFLALTVHLYCAPCFCKGVMAECWLLFVICHVWNFRNSCTALLNGLFFLSRCQKVMQKQGNSVDMLKRQFYNIKSIFRFNFICDMSQTGWNRQTQNLPKVKAVKWQWVLPKGLLEK